VAAIVDSISKPGIDGLKSLQCCCSSNFFHAAGLTAWKSPYTLYYIRMIDWFGLDRFPGFLIILSCCSWCAVQIHISWPGLVFAFWRETNTFCKMITVVDANHMSRFMAKLNSCVTSYCRRDAVDKLSPFASSSWDERFKMKQRLVTKLTLTVNAYITTADNIRMTGTLWSTGHKWEYSCEFEWNEQQ
jgi:hypothetical protein